MVRDLMYSDRKRVSFGPVGSRVCVVIYQTAEILSSFVIVCFQTLNLDVANLHVEAENTPKTRGMINAMRVKQRLSDGKVA